MRVCVCAFEDAVQLVQHEVEGPELRQFFRLTNPLTGTAGAEYDGGPVCQDPETPLGMLGMLASQVLWR